MPLVSLVASARSSLKALLNPFHQSRWYSDRAGTSLRPVARQKPDRSRLLSMLAIVPCVQQVPPSWLLTGVTHSSWRRSNAAGNAAGGGGGAAIAPASDSSRAPSAATV